MYITKAVLRDFGKFHNRELDLRPGINLIYGVNEAGKSTVRDFLVGMFYGIEKSRGIAARTDTYALRKPYDKPGFSGMLEVYAGGRAYQIERNFLKSERETRVIDIRTGERVKLTAPHSLLGTVLEADKTCYVNTLCIDGNGAKTEPALTDLLKNKMINMSTSHSMEVDKAQAVSLLKEKKKQFSTREIDRELKTLSLELYKEEDFEKQLDEVAGEYQRLQNKIAGIRQTEQDALKPEEKLYSITPRKKTEKSGVIFLVTLLLLALLWAGIYILPVAPKVKVIFWASSILSVVYIGVSAFSQKGRFKRRQNRNKRNRQRDYETQDAIDRVQIQQYTEQLASLKAKEERILEARKAKEAKWERYDALKVKAKAMEREVQAIDLAITTIEQLADSIYNGFGSTLNRKVSKLMAGITAGKYKQVFLGENLDIQVLDGDRYVPLAYLSAGTKEQLYFALRMVAAEILDAPSMPLLLDDIFITYDMERLKNTLSYLAEYKENQIILFTANPGIAELFDEIGQDYNYIAL